MIRLKCKDGKELRILRQSKIFADGFKTTELNAIESLSNSNDALKKEYCIKNGLENRLKGDTI